MSKGWGQGFENAPNDGQGTGAPKDDGWGQGFENAPNDGQGTGALRECGYGYHEGRTFGRIQYEEYSPTLSERVRRSIPHVSQDEHLTRVLGFVYDSQDVRDEQTLRERLEVQIGMAVDFSSYEGKGTDTAYCNRCGVQTILDESPRNKTGVSMNHAPWCSIGKAQAYLRTRPHNY